MVPQIHEQGGVVFCQGEEGEELEYQSEDEDEGGASEGTTEKVKFNFFTLPQVVAICVVSSFTENANHPDMLALIPTILIDKASFRICLYDCRKDVLLIFLNFRSFLQDLSAEVVANFPSVKIELFWL